jgi:hypothetical protein
MRVLVACEFSGRVREAFRAKGHDAWSCDLLSADDDSPYHYQCNVFDVLDKGWDLMIAHPPCTYLTVTGNSWFYHPDDKHLPTDERRPHPRFPNRRQHREEAVEFFMKLINTDIPKIAVENPVGIMSTRFRKPDQYIQPYEFGDPERKKTGLWLKGLPCLVPTDVVEPNIIQYKNGKGTDSKWHMDTMKLPPLERMKARSKTFQGIADAMADQWGKEE